MYFLPVGKIQREQGEVEPEWSDHSTHPKNTQIRTYTQGELSRIVIVFFVSLIYRLSPPKKKKKKLQSNFQDQYI